MTNGKERALSGKQKIIQTVQFFSEIMVLLVLFYRNIFIVIVLGIPLCFMGYRRLQKKWKQQEKWQLNLEFKEGLQGIAAALNAGYSMENALRESGKDLCILYGKDSLMYREFQTMQGQLQLNQSVESVFDEFAYRTDVEDIRSFAEIFRTARRSGGDLVSIVRTSADRIGEKIEVSREIHTMISGKAMEGKIMNIVPLGIILYFWVCSPGFLDCLYQGLWGHLIMTILLILYLAAYLLNQKICDIPL